MATRYRQGNLDISVPKSRLKMESRSSIFSASYVPNASISLPVVITVEDVADVSANGSVLEAVFLGEHYPIVSCRSESLFRIKTCYSSV